jgi:7-keto-8-aminopelargonate synthetase-like enzyme
MRSTTDLHNAADQVLTRAAQRGLLYRAAEDEAFSGRTIMVGGQELIQFGSCSYLGLELDPRLQEGAIEAIRRYGTQFSSSRAYVSAPPYAELEGLLGELFGMPALVTPSSTLAHSTAIPVLVEQGDAVVLDQQVHTTVQMAVNHVRVNGTHVEVLKHNRLDLLEQRVAQLARTHRRVWYMADGIYSMYGDKAPMAELAQLLERQEALHLYVDDAHGMSWIGQHGRGHALEVLPHHPRMVVVTSFAKGFGTGGGALLLPNDDQRRRVRTIGSSFVFSGPLQPATLGAAIASARLHLSGELAGLQAELIARVRLCNELCRVYGLPLVTHDEVPIRFVAAGLSSVAFEVVERMMEEGFYCNLSVFPAVPMQRAGIRFTITRHQTEEDITRFVQALARILPAALECEGSSIEAVRRTFKLTPPLVTEMRRVVPAASARSVQPKLTLQHETTIEALDASEWDRLLGGRGCFTHAGLTFLEAAYRDNPKPEDNWRFHYYMVRNAAGEPVAATFFTEALWKDDMLAAAHVSRSLEERRQDDPYWLTSTYMAMGALLTEGDHLYLDRSADWRGALRLVVKAVREAQEAAGIEHLVFRDVATDDTELDAFLHDQGFVRFGMPESFVQAVDWDTPEGFLATLDHDRRKVLRRKVFPWNEAYDVEVLQAGGRQPSAAELAHFHALYHNVKARNHELNTFGLPESFFERMLTAPGWEIVLFYARPVIGGQPGDLPVGLSACYVGPDQYVPLIAGLDYRHVEPHGLYRQLLWQNVLRARHHGKRWIFNGFGAPIEKTRLGAKARRSSAYVQTADLYQFEALGQAVMDARGAVAR